MIVDSLLSLRKVDRSSGVSSIKISLYENTPGELIDAFTCNGKVRSNKCSRTSTGLFIVEINTTVRN